MTFKAEIQHDPDKDHNRLWFSLNQGKLLVKRTREGLTLPGEGDFTRHAFASERTFYFGALDGRPCYATSLSQNCVLPDQFEWIDLRALFGSMQEELLWVAGRANQLLDWDRSHRFCGRCGGPTEDKTDERAKCCPRCGLLNYPRLSPAVIAAVLKGDHLLLARGKNFRVPMFSVLAGFVEPGETLEACVEREIREEVGIGVTNIRYFGSQPWPFPNSLMIGFVADYASGDIRVDGREIVEAGWFSKSNLPRIPPSISIARRLIDWFVEQASSTGEKGGR